MSRQRNAEVDQGPILRSLRPPHSNSAARHPQTGEPAQLLPYLDMFKSPAVRPLAELAAHARSHWLRVL